MIKDIRIPQKLFRKRKSQTTSLFEPQAFDENLMPALKLARSSRFARRAGQALLVLLVALFVIVAFAPWQQSVRGSGNVVGYAPQDRPQVIEAPIKGRVVRLGDGVLENAAVSQGQLIAEIQDLDPSYLSRLEGQRAAKRDKVDAQQLLVQANERNLQAIETVVQSLQTQLETYRTVKEQIVAGADALIQAAESKVMSVEQKLAENSAKLTQASQDFSRQKTLFAEQIVSQLKFQEAERKFREAEAMVAGTQADVAVAKADLLAKQRERDAKAQKAQVDIEYATAILQKANADVAKAESELAKAGSDLNTANADLLSAETAVARQQMQLVRAPVDGVITKITPNLGSEMLKEGDPICVIVPATEQRAVQIWLDGNDATLVEPGRHVRLQFEGWPAVQFAGWPSVAVGTFGGTITSLDPTDDGNGQFRVLVLPDPTDQSWPQGRYLRQGVRANGWVLLDQVPLWYEIWRKMNGFPPVVDTKPDATKSAKPPKLPKP